MRLPTFLLLVVRLRISELRVLEVISYRGGPFTVYVLVNEARCAMEIIMTFLCLLSINEDNDSVMTLNAEASGTKVITRYPRRLKVCYPTTLPSVLTMCTSRSVTMIATYEAPPTPTLNVNVCRIIVSSADRVRNYLRQRIMEDSTTGLLVITRSTRFYLPRLSIHLLAYFPGLRSSFSRM